MTKYIRDRNVYCWLFSVLLPGERRERGTKCFVYFRLPLRSFRSLLQSIDNQNVLGWKKEKGKGMKTRIDFPKCSVEVPCCLVYVPKLTHAVFKSNISSDKDNIRTSFVMLFFKVVNIWGFEVIFLYRCILDYSHLRSIGFIHLVEVTISI